MKINIPSLFKCELFLKLFKNGSNNLKIAAILLCFYYTLIKNCAISKLLLPFLIKNSHLRELGIVLYLLIGFIFYIKIFFL